MTRQEVTGNYIINMERERVRRGYTQPQMAKHMGISTSGYKKIVAGETSKIDLYAAYQLYKFTGKFIFELCGEKRGPGTFSEPAKPVALPEGICKRHHPI